MTRAGSAMILAITALLAVPTSSAGAHPEGAFGAPPEKARTREQVARFDDVPRVHTLRTGGGTWTIHKTESLGDRAYSSWYTAGVVALDSGRWTHLAPGTRRGWGDSSRRWARARRTCSPTASGRSGGVAVDHATGDLYVSDMTSGLWIVSPTGDAAPS